MGALEAFAIGALTQSSLLISGLVVYFLKLPRKAVGQLAGFGAGALLGAAAFDLVPETSPLANPEIAIWLLVGGSVYVVADRIIEGRLGDSGSSSGAMGIVVGNVNDALPESLIFGIQLSAGLALSFGFVAAVWISNIPQALPPSAELAASGWKRGKMALMWGAVVILAGLFSAAGFGIAEVLSAANGDRMAAFTIGGLITMLTTSMIPFAYDEGGTAAGLWAVIGFGASLAAA